jgi:hypothetical protein
MNAKYQILSFLRSFGGEPQTVEVIAVHVHCDALHAVISAMVHEELIFRCPHGYGVSGIRYGDDISGGWGYLDACERIPVEAQRERAWKDEALTGTTTAGRETEIKNGVVPSTGKTTPKDPERRFWRDVHRMKQGQGQSMEARHKRRLGRHKET